MNCLRHPMTLSCAPNTGRVLITRKLVTSSAVRAAESTNPCVTQIDRRQAIGGLVAMAPFFIVSPPASQAAEGSGQDTVAGKAVAQAISKFQAGNIQGVLDTFSPNIVWSSPKFAGSPFKPTYRGVQDVGTFFAKLGELVTITKFDLIKIVGSGRNAIVFIDYTGTVKATGKGYATMLIQDWTVDDGGALVSFNEYFSDAASVSAAFKA